LRSNSAGQALSAHVRRESLDTVQDAGGGSGTADGSTSHRYGGTGLGSSIASQLAAMISGRLGSRARWALTV